jgi:hypothetical protein
VTAENQIQPLTDSAEPEYTLTDTRNNRTPFYLLLTTRFLLLMSGDSKFHIQVIPDVLAQDITTRVKLPAQLQAKPSHIITLLIAVFLPADKYVVQQQHNSIAVVIVPGRII